MKRFGKLKLFGLVVFLTAALIFVGIDYLEGKKPPKWEWKVGIPNVLMAGQEDYNCNLYANPHGNPLNAPENGEYISYENNDFVDVQYWTSEDKDTGEIHSTFSLKLENTEKGITDGPGDYSIGFRDLQFIGCKSYCYLGGTGDCRCWVFPNYPGGVDCSGGEGCFDCDCTGPGSGGYGIMEDFMENNAHPSFGYDNFSLRIIVYCDVEAIAFDDPVTVDGHMWKINVWNTGDTLLSGDEEYHNIVCAYWILLEDVLVEKTGENDWTIIVDQCGFNDSGINNCPSKYGHSGRYIVFWEYYNQGIEKPIGKSGKSSIESERRWALGAATPFKFITKWTRF